MFGRKSAPNDPFSQIRDKIKHIHKTYTDTKRECEWYQKASNLDHKKEEIKKHTDKKEEYQSIIDSFSGYDETKQKECEKLKQEIHHNEECKQLYRELVLKLIHKKFRQFLECLLTVSSEVKVSHDDLDTKDKYRVYGLLLNACQIKGVNQRQEMVEGHWNEYRGKTMCHTLDMLKLLPPLVVCRPVKYDYEEEIQDTNRATWDDENVEGSLTYYRPVLVYGNHLHMAVKGLVGNKELTVKAKASTFDLEGSLDAKHTQESSNKQLPLNEQDESIDSSNDNQVSLVKPHNNEELSSTHENEKKPQENNEVKDETQLRKITSEEKETDRQEEASTDQTFTDSQDSQENTPNFKKEMHSNEVGATGSQQEISNPQKSEGNSIIVNEPNGTIEADGQGIQGTSRESSV